MSTSTFVTSHLVLGDVPTGISGHIVRVESAEEAVQVIDNGGTAVLPAGDWDDAATVLRLFGADVEHVKRQIAMAQGKFTQ
jgi:hypothetical protein